MDDSISRKWLMECVEEGWIKFDTDKDENRFIRLVRDIAPSAQPERSLRFRIGEICVDESKGFISSGRAVEKIRGLLREAERRQDETD